MIPVVNRNEFAAARARCVLYVRMWVSTRVFVNEPWLPDGLSL